MKWALNFGGFSFFADKKCSRRVRYRGIRDPVFISGGYRVASEGFVGRCGPERPLWLWYRKPYCQQDVAFVAQWLERLAQ